MKKVAQKLIRRFGYEIRKTGNFNLRVDAEYILNTFTREDGSFDYERYKSIQTKGNHAKINETWTNEETIALAAEIIKSCGTPTFGICHGTRQGFEQQWFKKYLQSEVNCEVIGTEISDSATRFRDTIQWDFHHVKEEWLNSTDFIYSNSWDHSYDPKLCLQSWTSCLRQEGICLLDYSKHHDSPATSELDPFGAPLQTLLYLIIAWGKGDYFVTNIINYVSSRGPGCLIAIRKSGFTRTITLTEMPTQRELNI